jgi:8-oxo-dGTP diphosphatase
MYKLLVSAGVLIKNDNIFLPKRSGKLKHSPNKYEFPGGKLEKGETFKDALKRELYEELSIEVDYKNIIDFPNNIVENDEIILNVFIVNEWKNEIKLNPEINSEILTIGLHELKNVEDLLETDKQVIPSIYNFIQL